MSAVWRLFRLEVLLAMRSHQTIVSLLFYLAVVLVFPFAIGPDAKLLADLGPAILWAGALFSSLFGLDRLFGSDAEDGTLDHLRLSRVPLPILVLIKASVLWLTTLVPLVLATPMLSLVLNLSPAAVARLVLALLLGTPALSLLGTLVAALTAGIKRGGLLMPVLALPFALPVLIFGSAVAKASSAPGTADPAVVLVSLSAILLVLAPVVGAKAIDLGQE